MLYYDIDIINNKGICGVEAQITKIPIPMINLSHLWPPTTRPSQTTKNLCFHQGILWSSYQRISKKFPHQGCIPFSAKINLGLLPIITLQPSKRSTKILETISTRHKLKWISTKLSSSKTNSSDRWLWTKEAQIKKTNNQTEEPQRISANRKKKKLFKKKWY